MIKFSMQDRGVDQDQRSTSNHRDVWKWKQMDDGFQQVGSGSSYDWRFMEKCTLAFLINMWKRVKTTIPNSQGVCFRKNKAAEMAAFFSWSSVPNLWKELTISAMEKPSPFWRQFMRKNGSVAHLRKAGNSSLHIRDVLKDCYWHLVWILYE